MRQAQRGASEAMGWPDHAKACVRTTRILYRCATIWHVTNLNLAQKYLLCKTVSSTDNAIEKMFVEH
jgi:hypothetical protein